MSETKTKYYAIFNRFNPKSTLLSQQNFVSRRVLLWGVGSFLTTMALGGRANSHSLGENKAKNTLIASEYPITDSFEQKDTIITDNKPSLTIEGETVNPSEMISGKVFYRQRIALPPNATLIVKLEDISRADAPSVVISEKKIDLKGQQVPISFTLTYDPQKIDPRFRYSVRAQIFVEDQLMWTSTQVYPVITQNNPKEVEIQLEPVRRRNK